MVTQEYARRHIAELFPQWRAGRPDNRNHLDFWFWLRSEHPHLCGFRCQGYADRKMRHWVLQRFGSVFDV
ncbi:MAG TPA: hypothetical protein VF718_13515 [Allosphingosinicella sp.]|jgi:hypothetical protein